MTEIKNAPNIKKVIVELENGKTLEFDKQFVLFAEDEMSDTEKAVSDGDNKKVCGVMSCKPSFAAAATGSLLDTLATKAPGVDKEVIMKHLEATDNLVAMLAEVFG